MKFLDQCTGTVKFIDHSAGTISCLYPCECTATFLVQSKCAANILDNCAGQIKLLIYYSKGQIKLPGRATAQKFHLVRITVQKFDHPV